MSFMDMKTKLAGLMAQCLTDTWPDAQGLLTAEEIRAAKGIIVAADKNVEMQRFYGKRLLQVPVADGIRKPVVA